MKLAVAQQIPREYSQERIMQAFAAVENQVNLLTEGRFAGRHFNAASIPTAGAFARGDIVWKSSPSEAGSAGSKYVIIGWICTVGGEPGTLLEMRVLTGN